MRNSVHCNLCLGLALIVGAVTAEPALAQPDAADNGDASSDPMDVLSPGQWEEVGEAIDRALTWLARQQRPDGSFPSRRETGQPGLTGLCAMAFLARGHVPGEGPYGATIDRAVEFVLSCQKPNGLLTKMTPRGWSVYGPSHTAHYNHGICGVLLCEVYGMTGGEKAQRIRRAIEKALDYTLADQKKIRRNPVDQGGWRYAGIEPENPSEADVSVTSWHLMFYRAAENAGFEVSSDHVDHALAYVKRCYLPRLGTFIYGLSGVSHRSDAGRAMTGAGILSLSLGGLHHTPEARAAADWLIKHPIDHRYRVMSHPDQYFYGAYHCSLAMFQMGGRYWDRFYPPLASVLLATQSPEGAWHPKNYPAGEREFGSALTTPLAVMALAVPYQLVPIYQR